MTVPLYVPEHPIIPFIEGDGIGRDIWPATRLVIEASVAKAYANQKSIHWVEVLVGEKGYEPDRPMVVR